MSKKFNEDFSITIRPRLDKFEKISRESDFHSDLLTLIEKIGFFSVVAIEKDNHYQIALNLKKQSRQDKLKDKILRILKKYIELDELEIKIALVVKIHYDIKGLVGYCLKECEGNFWLSNIKDDFKTECITYYDRCKLDKKLKNDKIKVNTRNIGNIFENFMTAHTEKFKKDKYENKYTTTTIMEALAYMDKERYNISGILLSKNLNTVVDYLVHRMNDKMAKWIMNRERKLRDKENYFG